MKDLRDISWQEGGVITMALRAYRFNLKMEIKHNPSKEEAYKDRLKMINDLLEEKK